jgi:hypothetical protein
MVFGSNNWFDDVAAPRVLPDTSAVADSFSDLFRYSHLTFLQLSGCSPFEDAIPARLEFRSIGPETVQEHRKAPCYRDLRPAHAPPPGDLHPPCSEPVPGSDPAQQDRRGLAKQGTHHPVPAARNPAIPVSFP